MSNKYTFGEAAKEWSAKQGKEIPVYRSAKYEESRAKAIELIEDGRYGLKESDFWILKNETKTAKMGYTGLIISHNGCLKINDQLPDRFDASCVRMEVSGYNDSLICIYQSKEQGIFEVGEVSKSNCKNDYPYAMAVKRLFDRVVLKLSKVAYAGIYGEDEADEFRQPIDDQPAAKSEPVKSDAAAEAKLKKDKQMLMTLCQNMDVPFADILARVGWKQGEMATQEQINKALIVLKEISDARNDG